VPLKLDPDRFQGLIDYNARTEFLDAISDLLRPAPVDELLELLPTVRAWLATIPQTAPASTKRYSITMGIASGIISPIDDSNEAEAVKQAIADWMRNCRFFHVDWTWIVADYALPTLLLHAADRCEKRKWYRMEPWRELNPQPVVAVPRRGNESNRDYKARFDKECRRASKEIIRPVQFQTGALTKTKSRDAQWTVRHLCLERTFTEICNDQPDESGNDESRVGKAVLAFRCRAGL
jgi:hypothetical protein